MCHPVDENEADRGKLGAETWKLIRERWDTPGESLRGWPRTEETGEVLLAANALGGAMGLSKLVCNLLTFETADRAQRVGPQ